MCRVPWPRPPTIHQPKQTTASVLGNLIEMEGWRASLPVSRAVDRNFPVLPTTYGQVPISLLLSLPCIGRIADALQKEEDAEETLQEQNSVPVKIRALHATSLISACSCRESVCFTKILLLVEEDGPLGVAENCYKITTCESGDICCRLVIVKFLLSQVQNRESKNINPTTATALLRLGICSVSLDATPSPGPASPSGGKHDHWFL